VNIINTTMRSGMEEGKKKCVINFDKKSLQQNVLLYIRARSMKMLKLIKEK
jgi:hypothetical protein